MLTCFEFTILPAGIIYGIYSMQYIFCLIVNILYASYLMFVFITVYIDLAGRGCTWLNRN